MTTHAPPENLTRFAWLSLGVSLLVFALKVVAWWITGSVGLFSDAMESTVNIVAAVVAIIALRASARPADERHHFGHGKAEYMSALLEGVMILVAAGLIIYSAVQRLKDLQPLEDLGIGLGISMVASVINAAVAFVLIRAGRRHRALVLEADGKHLLTDVWTSVGVLVGIALVGLTGWIVLDPLIAILVAVNIVVTGMKLVWESTEGLMDHALPEADHQVIREVLRTYAGDDVRFHEVRTRQAGRERFISMHVLVPGAWTVQRGHDLVESIEQDLRQALGDTRIDSHMEPIEDPRAYGDGPPGGLSTEDCC